ncbi:fumarylacetoacetate hydrolase family protein [Paenarthrobacter nicotinovorans]|uniref:fumarylacetoacetate hydrolase family protein n=1 Tax=Paenarthrobacter nicotinovorans TaxID=29320 RepID=UPI0038275EC7
MTTATDLQLPIAVPSKIVCVGLNYRDHAIEAGLEVPANPVFFAKWPNSLTGPDTEILVPEGVRTDFEAELAVVIGRKARNVSREEALDYVAGYLCANDVSARDHQFEDGQWVRAKSLDTFCPLGPELVPADQIADPQNLGIKLWLNGVLMQDSSTAEMVFGVADIISYLSTTATLEPGDVILTGTPAGVGVFRNPPVGLKDGDVVTVDIEHIGSLTNRVRTI